MDTFSWVLVASNIISFILHGIHIKGRFTCAKPAVDNSSTSCVCNVDVDNTKNDPPPDNNKPTPSPVVPQNLAAEYTDTIENKMEELIHEMEEMRNVNMNDVIKHTITIPKQDLQDIQSFTPISSPQPHKIVKNHGYANNKDHSISVTPYSLHTRHS